MKNNPQTYQGIFLKFIRVLKKYIKRLFEALTFSSGHPFRFNKGLVYLYSFDCEAFIRLMYCIIVRVVLSLLYFCIQSSNPIDNSFFYIFI